MPKKILYSVQPTEFDIAICLLTKGEK